MKHSCMMYKPINFVYSERLANGFHTYTSREKAQITVNDLNKLAKDIGFKKEFHIEKIDLCKELIEEKNLSKINYPFISEKIYGVKATDVA